MLRFWYDSGGDVTEAFSITGHAEREYNDADIEEVEDSYGFKHIIDKRSGADKQIATVIITMALGQRDQLNAATPTPLAFGMFLLAAYKSKATIEIFDDDPDDDAVLAYKGTITQLDRALRSNKTQFRRQITEDVQLKLVLEAEGTYSDFDDLSTASYETRP